MSHQLHPSKLHFLGLAAAVRPASTRLRSNARFGIYRRISKKTSRLVCSARCRNH
jgi:hypothetical protein